MFDFTDGGFLGYFNECRLNRIVDYVIDNYPIGANVNLVEAARAVGIDPNSLSNSDIDYIIKKLG